MSAVEHLTDAPTPAPSSGAHRGASAIAHILARRGLVAVVPFDDKGRGQVTGLALAESDGGEATALRLDDDDSLSTLAAWAGRSDRVFLFEDAKPAMVALRRRGVRLRRVVCRQTLERLLGEGAEETRMAMDAGSARDQAFALHAALEPLLRRIEAAGLHKVARLECLVLGAFAALEARGLYVDVPKWRALVDDAKKRADAGRAQVFSLLGDAVSRDLFGVPDLNLDSDAEVKVVLERLLKTNLVDVSRHTLRATGHEVGEALIAYREARKIVTTYGDAFLAQVDPKTSRVHATFVPLGASTGRVSSHDPNLQNLPSDRAFHECLRAPEGRVLVTADYATCELRILADLSEDPVFIAAFENGEDLHSRVAERIFKKPVSKEENSELRARAKAINFGLMYGMGAAALGAATESTLEDAEKLLELYFQSFPRIKSYLEGSVDTALKRGYAETVLGRRLHFSAEALANRDARGELGRIAKNMPIQGTSADMTKLAMVRVHERLEEMDDAGLVNTIHDELVVECRAEDGEAVANAVREEMEAAHRTLLSKVPPEVDVHVGPYWAH